MAHITELTQSDIEDAEKNALNQWSANPSRPQTLYRKGLIKDANKIGYLTEKAFSTLIGIDHDINYMHGGDEYDFLIDGKTVDIKGSKNYRSTDCLITAINEEGKSVYTIKDYYVFGLFLENPTRILWKGYATRDMVSSSPIKPSPTKSLHQNYVIPNRILKPMDELLAIIHSQHRQ